MALPNIFTPEVTDELVGRINKLSAATPPQWGKMTAPQMLAHCNVSYELVYTDKHPKPKGLMKLILKMLVKNKVVSEIPYKKGGPTAPAFIIKDSRDFELEKARLIAYLQRTQLMGETNFDGKESHSFGPLTLTEWNNMFYKHINHHLTQFGA